MQPRNPHRQKMTTEKRPGSEERVARSAKRRYNSPLRQRQSAETRNRIIHAGSELVHGFHAWDWTNLTARAVSERAGVSERTVQRYFPTERELRDAVLQRLVEESGVRLEALELGHFAAVTAQMFSYLSSFAATPSKVTDPSFASVDRLRREALLGAVGRATPGWSDRERESAAAVLDILWNQSPYQRLIEAWEFDAERAVDTITWLIELIEEAVRKGRRPVLDK